MADNLVKTVPLFDDIQQFSMSSLRPKYGSADGIMGGFPCQAHCHSQRNCVERMSVCLPDPFSSTSLQGVSRAGKCGGMSDSRTNLATHMWRLVDDCSANLGSVWIVVHGGCSGCYCFIRS